jgi:hypothetical protein
MCGSYFQESKPSLFAGFMFLKKPIIREIPVHEVKTIMEKMGLKGQRHIIHRNMQINY